MKIVLCLLLVAVVYADQEKRLFLEEFDVLGNTKKSHSLKCAQTFKERENVNREKKEKINKMKSPGKNKRGKWLWKFLKQNIDWGREEGNDVYEAVFP